MKYISSPSLYMIGLKKRQYILYLCKINLKCKQKKKSGEKILLILLYRCNTFTKIKVDPDKKVSQYFKMN